MNKNNGKVRFSIDRSGFFAESAVFLLFMSIIFRVIGCWGMWTDRVSAIMNILLPVSCCLLLILCVLLLGKKGFFLSFIPVLLGVVFFVFKSLSFDNWLPIVLSILLYMVIAVAYTGTVFGWIPTKWLLPPLFGLPFLYRVYTDLRVLSEGPESVSFLAGMQELSILCIVAAVFCIGMGLKKRASEPTVIEPEVVEPEPVPEQEPAPASEPETVTVSEQKPVSVVDTEPVPSGEQGTASSLEPDSLEPASDISPEEFLNEEPYHATLTLDPEPWEPEGPSHEEMKPAFGEPD